MNVEDKIQEMADSIAAEAKERFLERFDDLSFKVEEWSPIEKLMGYGLLHALSSTLFYDGDGGFNGFMHQAFIADFDLKKIDWHGAECGIAIIPQMKVDQYRADFGVILKHWRGQTVIGAIECDGHDFHEKTKAQASRDKARDRHFQSKGLIVLRYTGSEIYRDPINVAAGALGIFNQRADALGRER